MEKGRYEDIAQAVEATVRIYIGTLLGLIEEYGFEARLPALCAARMLRISFLHHSIQPSRACTALQCLHCMLGRAAETNTEAECCGVQRRMPGPRPRLRCGQRLLRPETQKS